MVVVASVVGGEIGKLGVDESVTVTVVAEAIVVVVPLIMVMVKRYSLMIVLPAGHVVVAMPCVGVALIVTVGPTGHVDLEADAVTVTVDAGCEAADAVTVTVLLLRIDGVRVTVLPDAAGHVDVPATVTVVVLPLAADAAGHVDEPAIVTVEVPAVIVTPGFVTVIVGPAIAEPETVSNTLFVTVTVPDTVVVTAEPVSVTVEAVAVTVFVM